MSTAVIKDYVREERSEAVEKPSRAWHYAAGSAAGFAVLIGLAFVIGKPDPTRAETGITMQSREVAQLKTLSTGKQAESIVEGTSAQERNALIPVSGSPVQRMGAFNAIGQGTGAHNTALKCLTQAIYYEAANEPLQGKRAVAQVVLNRLRHPAYPGSVCGVVYEGVNKPVCQFSFTCDGSLARTPLANKWGESRKVAEAALAGFVEPSVGSATHYHADYVLPRWAFTLDKIEKIGLHIFYRFPGSAGQPRAFTRGWSGREAIPAIDRTHWLTAIAETEPVYTPGTTVTPDVKDRHAPTDVGGRIDTTKTWRLSIPDPVNSGGSYQASLAAQGEIDSQGTAQ
ncbi:cell wall hydrolase [Altererythrobacter sp. GH1-8]|uniref:cell wall hydrolase n=1 Tax=Altererythrobacter sp. GH1-8 TaxID=3349333 RepID=UPI00374D5505